MNTSEESFEYDLRRLPATATSRQLRSSIAEELNSPKTDSGDAHDGRGSLWFAWFVAGVCASISAALLLRDAIETAPNASVSGSQPANSGDIAATDEMRMVPVDTSGMLLVALDEGIVYLESGQPVRKVRLQYVDTVRLRNPGAAAALEITTPREEVRFVPVDTL
jgi:hypothetical protein